MCAKCYRFRVITSKPENLPYLYNRFYCITGFDASATRATAPGFSAILPLVSVCAAPNSPGTAPVRAGTAGLARAASLRTAACLTLVERAAGSTDSTRSQTFVAPVRVPPPVAGPPVGFRADLPARPASGS